MRAIEFLSEDDTPRIKLGGNTSKAKAWIQKVYDLYPGTFQNNHVMSWGEGDDQQFAMFELVPSMSRPNAVEVKWFQAYPLRQGVGSRAMQELQRLAKEDGIGLTLFPWDKGQVSQAKLMKFYKGQGFQPNKPGSKNMYWSPEEINEAFDTPYKLKWEKGDFGDYDAYAALDDGTNLSIMFNKEDDGTYQVEFWRGASQSVTGEGDAQRVFATVLTAIQQFIKKIKPASIFFSASKDVDPGQNSESRAKLYTRLVQRYANAWGYTCQVEDHSDLVMYHLTSRNSLDEAELDPRGWGAVPQSIDIDYFGLQVQMRPSMFLKLARPLEKSDENPEVYSHMEKGGKIAYPWLDFAEPVEWEEGDFSKDAKVRTHEGRNRMHKWIKMHGDDPIPVHIFFKNANRRRFITDEMILKLSQGAFNETGQWVNGPLFDPKTAQ